MAIDASIFTQGALIAYGLVFLGGIVSSEKQVFDLEAFEAQILMLTDEKAR